MLWWDLKTTVHEQMPTNLSELTQWCRTEWPSIPPQWSERLIASSRQQLGQACRNHLSAKGFYKLLNHGMYLVFHRSSRLPVKTFSQLCHFSVLLSCEDHHSLIKNSANIYKPYKCKTLQLLTNATVKTLHCLKKIGVYIYFLFCLDEH